MKRVLHPSLFLLVVLLSTASMCNDDDDNDDAGTTSVERSLGYGTWRITYFFDKEDETSDFIGYSFQFNDDGIVVATKSGLSVQGTWHTEDTSHGHTQLYLDFGAGAPLEELNEDWIVASTMGAKITLEHESGGNGEIDSLVLERN